MVIQVFRGNKQHWQFHCSFSIGHLKFILLFFRFYTAYLIGWGGEKHTKNPQYCTLWFINNVYFDRSIQFSNLFCHFQQQILTSKEENLQYIALLTLISHYLRTIRLAEYSIRILTGLDRKSRKTYRNTINIMSLQ